MLILYFSQSSIVVFHKICYFSAYTTVQTDINDGLQAGLRKLEEKTGNREMFLASKGDRNFISICEEVEGEYIHQAVAPIICEGDIIGSVVFLENDNKGKMGEVEQKLVLSAAGFLGRQMEQ